MAGHNSDSKDNIIDSKPDCVKYYLLTILQQSTAMPFRRHESQYQCFYCDSIFLLPSELKEHNSQTHDRMEPMESLRIWTDFNITSNLMVDIKDLTCKVCKTQLSDINDLTKHFKEKHNESFPKDVLNHIIRFKLSDNSIKCYLCQEEFEFFGNLIHHMKSRPHARCHTCKENFTSKKRFAEHESARCKPCSLCNIRFQSTKQRNLHLKRVHCKSLECDFCSKTFKFKMTLARHIRNIHYKEKNGTCDFCGKTFFNMFYLKMHVNGHIKLRLFKCDICEKKFVKKEAMKIHKRIHTNERRYICDICGKAFIQCGAYHKHKSVHSDVRNFKCPVCNKAYKDKKSLWKHCRNVHQQEYIT